MHIILGTVVLCSLPRVVRVFYYVPHSFVCQSAKATMQQNLSTRWRVQRCPLCVCLRQQALRQTVTKCRSMPSVVSFCSLCLPYPGGCVHTVCYKSCDWIKFLKFCRTAGALFISKICRFTSIPLKQPQVAIRCIVACGLYNQPNGLCDWESTERLFRSCFPGFSCCLFFYFGASWSLLLMEVVTVEVN